MPYDSKKDTMQHINKVKELGIEVVRELDNRFMDHDKSKLWEPEKSVFDKYTPLLKDSEYGSDEYKSFLDDMKPALEHHYAENRHHPEHFENGIKDMNLIDLMEMLTDWKAASLRHDSGDILKSIEINKKRFKFTKELEAIFLNTVKDLGW